MSEQLAQRSLVFATVPPTKQLSDQKPTAVQSPNNPDPRPQAQNVMRSRVVTVEQVGGNRDHYIINHYNPLCSRSNRDFLV